MAFGFIKKIFSFGDKKVVEEGQAADVSAETAVQPAAEAPPPPAPSPEPPVEGPVPDFLLRPDEETAAPAEAPAAAPEPEIPPVAEPRPVPEVPVEMPEPPRDPLSEPEPEIPPVEDVPHPPAGEDGAVTPTPPSPPEQEAGGERETASAEAETPSPARVTVKKAVEKKAEPVAPAPAPAPKTPWFQRLTQGLSRSSRELRDSISGVFTRRKLDDDTLQDLEDVLIRADLGMETAIRVTDALASGRYGKDISDEEVRTVMAAEIEKVLTPVALPLELDLSHKPHVVLVVGVNGTGKTTTIGKLAAKLTAGGLKVTLAAGDTFRAAAIEQLKIWGERTGSPVVSSKLGADAAGLAWDAYEKARAAGSDVLIIDTAGRLQNKAELMAELEKIVRVLSKHDAEAPHTVLQTVDATTGQNALNQVEIFRNVAGVNGLVMTKLDGTARGGILVAIAAKHKLPVYFIGVGEQVDDLEPFSAGDFAKAIAGVE